MIGLIKGLIHRLSSGSTSNVERDTWRQSLSEEAYTGFVSQVDVRVHQARHRLCDPDGASVKAVLDAIVAAGLLRDDGPEEVREVRFTQERIGTDQVEYTRVELIPV